MSFEKFSKFGRRNSSFITITASQSFGFGADFLEKNNLLNKKFVELFFDKEDGLRIAFKFKDEREADSPAFKLIENKGTNSKNLVARSFFTTYLQNVNLDEYESKYKPEVVQDLSYGTLFSIKLKKKT